MPKETFSPLPFGKLDPKQGVCKCPHCGRWSLAEGMGHTEDENGKWVKRYKCGRIATCGKFFRLPEESPSDPQPIAA